MSGPEEVDPEFDRRLQEAAEYYERVGNDPDEWGEPEPPPTREIGPRRMSVQYGVRFDPDEFRAVEAAARARGVTVPAWLRSLALNAAQQTTFSTGAPVVSIRRGA